MTIKVFQNDEHLIVAITLQMTPVLPTFHYLLFFIQGVHYFMQKVSIIDVFTRNPSGIPAMADTKK